MNFGQVLPSGIPTAVRKYAAILMSHIKQIGFKRVFIPASGDLGLVKAAMVAGFAPEDIYASDIGLFPTILGYVICGKPFDDLDVVVLDQEMQGYLEESNRLEKFACVIVSMKLGQLRKTIALENLHIEDLRANTRQYITTVAEQLGRMEKEYKGVNFSRMDIRFMFDGTFDLETDDFVLVDATVSNKTFSRADSVENFIEWDAGANFFDGKEEFVLYYNLSSLLPATFMWYTNKDTIQIEMPEDQRVYMKRAGRKTWASLYCTHPEVFDNFSYAYRVDRPKATHDSILHYELYPRDRMLKPEDYIQIYDLNKETALYYRDLFAHRLGTTVAAHYFGIFVNGKLMSTVGFNFNHFRNMRMPCAFENFCFSVSHDSYENLNRLGMLLLTSGQFYERLVHHTLKNSAYAQLKFFRTICILKYRKSKLNTGILDVIHREKMDNGTYKVLYEHEFYWDRSYKDCLDIFLTKDFSMRKAGALSVQE